MEKIKKVQNEVLGKKGMAILIFISTVMSMIMTYDMIMYLVGDGYRFILNEQNGGPLVEVLCGLLDNVKSLFVK